MHIEWRRRWTAALLLAIAALVSSCTGRPDGIEPVSGFQPARYAGTWYEIMRLDHRFERGLTNVDATYTPRDDGRLSVINRGFDRAACAWKSVEGTAAFQAGPDTASLSVTFFWPFAGGYHVFALDREDYAWAAVSGPTRDYLWILARRPDLPAETSERLVAMARDLGFPVAELILVDHTPPSCTP